MRTFSLFIFSILSLLTLISCKENTEKASTTTIDTSAVSVTVTSQQLKLGGIKTSEPEKRTISEVIHASGMLDVPPQSKVSISAPIGGTVKNTDLLQGSHVHKNDLIVTLQNIEYIQLQQDYKEVSSQLDFLQNEYARQEQLSKEEVNSKKTLEKARSDFEVAKAHKEGLRAKLELLSINMAELEQGHIQSSVGIRSPIDGYITKVLVNTGSYVNPNNVMVEIVNTEHLHAELTIFERDIPRIKAGQRVHFTLANEKKQRTATVYLVGKEIASDRSVRVHCHLDEEDKDLLPGMYLQAEIEIDSGSVTAVPDEAIVEYEGKKYIFSENKEDTQKNTHNFILHEVRTGQSEDGYTHVELPEDLLHRKIVIKGGYSLLAKIKNTEEGE